MQLQQASVFPSIFTLFDESSRFAFVCAHIVPLSNKRSLSHVLISATWAAV